MSTSPINVTRFDRELVARGLDGRSLARLSGVSEVTISKARHGRPVKASTLRKMAAALAACPLQPGAELL